MQDKKKKKLGKVRNYLVVYTHLCPASNYSKNILIKNVMVTNCSKDVGILHIQQQY